MTATVRLAALPDIPDLVGLMDDFYAEASFPLDHAIAARSFDALLRQPSLGAVWLMLHEEQPAGYVVLTTRFAMEYGGLDGFIDDLFVRPRFRRRGLAASALAELVAEAHRRDLLALHVEVGQENQPAQALYRSLGMAPRTDSRQLLTLPFEPAGRPPT